MLRAVCDSNVLVSGFIAHAGTPYEIIAAWQRGVFVLLTSRAIIAEVTTVLGRPFFREQRHVSDEDIADIDDLMQSDAVVVDPSERLRAVATDPDDDRILECALSGEADYIISGDHHLLALGTYQDIPIVTARYFLDLLSVGSS
jgi:putative PIN family toxin of toxin-antitoxin system